MLLEDYLDAVDFIELRPATVGRDQWVDDLRRRRGAASFGAVI